jgi:tRNA(Arg) A34 adenosine deaminase TadA
MSLSSALLFRVNHIVYGTPDHRLGAVGSHIHLLDQKHPFHTISSVQQIANITLQQQCSSIVQEFFRAKRIQRKNC